MTTLTNSEGRILNYTDEFIETILLQLNPSSNYYTTGDDDVIFINRFYQSITVRFYISYK